MLRQFLRSFLKTSIVSKNILLNKFDCPVVILIYHRVTDLKNDPQQLAVSPANFYNQIKYLKSTFPVLRFEDDWSDSREPSVVITFDDGYADNVREALPILEELAIPATFFVSTSSIGVNQEFWWDELERLILGEWCFNTSFKLDSSRYGKVWPTKTVDDRLNMYKEIHLLIKKMDSVCRDGLLESLRAWARVDNTARPTHCPMTLEELRRLSQSNWATIGAHTVTHTPLSSLPVKLQTEEIVGSKRQLEEWLAKEITVFSYPFGGRCDYSRATVQLCKRAGFVKVAANFPGQVHWWTDPYQLPRQLVRNWPVELFAGKMERFWTA